MRITIGDSHNQRLNPQSHVQSRRERSWNVHPSVCIAWQFVGLEAGLEAVVAGA